MKAAKYHEKTEGKVYPRTPSRVEILERKQDMDNWFKEMTQQAEEEFERDSAHGSRRQGVGSAVRTAV